MIFHPAVHSILIVLSRPVVLKMLRILWNAFFMTSAPFTFHIPHVENVLHFLMTGSFYFITGICTVTEKGGASVLHTSRFRAVSCLSDNKPRNSNVSRLRIQFLITSFGALLCYFAISVREMNSFSKIHISPIHSRCCGLNRDHPC